MDISAVYMIIILPRRYTSMDRCVVYCILKSQGYYVDRFQLLVIYVDIWT